MEAATAPPHFAMVNPVSVNRGLKERVRTLCRLFFAFLLDILRAIKDPWSISAGIQSPSPFSVNTEQQPRSFVHTCSPHHDTCKKPASFGNTNLHLPSGMEDFDLYEAVLRPDDQLEFIGMLYDDKTNQWKLSPGSTKEAGQQLARLQARDDPVLVICSRKLLQGLAQGAAGKSMFTMANTQHGLITHHQTLVTKVHCAPRFHDGELLKIYLSGHDVFHIRNLKDFLLHINRSDNAAAVMAASGGAFMKSWLVTVLEILLILNQDVIHDECKEAFWKLYSCGFVSTIYIQIQDRDIPIKPNDCVNIEIKELKKWLKENGATPDAAVMKTITFFLQPYTRVCEGTSSLPEIHIVSSTKIISTLPLHTTTLAHSVAVDTPAEISDGAISPFQRHHHVSSQAKITSYEPGIQNPHPYPHPPRPQVSDELWTALRNIVPLQAQPSNLHQFPERYITGGKLSESKTHTKSDSQQSSNLTQNMWPGPSVSDCNEITAESSCSQSSVDESRSHASLGSVDSRWEDEEDSYKPNQRMRPYSGSASTIGSSSWSAMTFGKVDV